MYKFFTVTIENPCYIGFVSEAKCKGNVRYVPSALLSPNFGDHR